MDNRLFNIILIMLISVWIVISIILPVSLGYVGLFALGILILVVLMLWVLNSRRIKNKSKPFVLKQPQEFVNLEKELKELFDREKAKGVSEVKKEVVPKKIVKKKTVTKVKPKYVASTEGGAYHKNICRFSKLIKGKYRLENTSRSFFTKKKYPACKMCKPGKN